MWGAATHRASQQRQQQQQKQGRGPGGPQAREEPRDRGRHFCHRPAASLTSLGPLGSPLCGWPAAAGHKATWLHPFKKRPMIGLIFSSQRGCAEEAGLREKTQPRRTESYTQGWVGGLPPNWAGLVISRRKWQPTPGFLPGESHGQRSLVGYSPRGRKESETTERPHFLSFPGPPVTDLQGLCNLEEIENS